MTDLISNLVDIWMESAPYLVLGLAIAGLMKALIPADWMQRQLGGRSRWNIVKAAFIGAPLPLCSCGVVPAALGLRRAGASKGSTVSFLVATPETGPDSISLSYVLLGPFMAVARPVAAVASAVAAGLMVRHEEQSEVLTKSISSSCCGSQTVEKKASTCCDTQTAISQSKTGVWQSTKEGLNYSFGKLLDDIAVWLLIGIAVAAAIQTYVPTAWLAEWGQGWTAMLLMAVIGVPMYICASASTPIAAGFLAAGVSPGAVLVFMLAGPATNIGTLGIIRKELGQQSLVAYLTGVVGTALVLGWLTDWLLVEYNWMGAVTGVHHMDHSYGWLEIGSSILLVALIIKTKYKK